jgi:hypothetical protein
MIVTLNNERFLTHTNQKHNSQISKTTIQNKLKKPGRLFALPILNNIQVRTGSNDFPVNDVIYTDKEELI